MEAVWDLSDLPGGKEEYDKLTGYIDKDESIEKKDTNKGKDKCPIKVDFDALIWKVSFVEGEL